jgi:hypothetical protein
MTLSEGGSEALAKGESFGAELQKRHGSCFPDVIAIFDAICGAQSWSEVKEGRYKKKKKKKKTRCLKALALLYQTTGSFSRKLVSSMSSCRFSFTNDGQHFTIHALIHKCGLY